MPKAVVFILLRLGLTKEIRSRKWCLSLAFIYNWEWWWGGNPLICFLSRHRPRDVTINWLYMNFFFCHSFTNIRNEIAPREGSTT